MGDNTRVSPENGEYTGSLVGLGTKPSLGLPVYVIISLKVMSGGTGNSLSGLFSRTALMK